MKTERILGGVMWLLVLRKLVEGPSYGYALEKFLAEKLGRQIPPGTIYTILLSLKGRRLISVKEKTVQKGRDVTKYEITQQGREFLLRHKEPMMAMRRVSDDLIKVIRNLE